MQFAHFTLLPEWTSLSSITRDGDLVNRALLKLPDRVYVCSWSTHTWYAVNIVFRPGMIFFCQTADLYFPYMGEVLAFVEQTRWVSVQELQARFATDRRFMLGYWSRDAS